MNTAPIIPFSGRLSESARAFRALLHRDFKIWGSDWEGDALLASRVQRGGRAPVRKNPYSFITPQNQHQSHSSLQGGFLVSDGDFVNPRTFELAAMEAFQLVDRRSLMRNCFVLKGIRAELAVFPARKKMEQAIDFYLAHRRNGKPLRKEAGNVYSRSIRISTE